jgi:hypothetical protein
MRRKNLMHWFWRAAIAAVVGMIWSGLTLVMFEDVLYDPVYGWLVSWFGFARPLGGALIVPPVYFLPTIVVVLLCYGYLTRRFYRFKGLDHETRCRQCGYILRGITEPRCSECGERI